MNRIHKFVWKLPKKEVGARTKIIVLGSRQEDGSRHRGAITVDRGLGIESITVHFKPDYVNNDLDGFSWSGWLKPVKDNAKGYWVITPTKTFYVPKQEMKEKCDNNELGDN